MPAPRRRSARGQTPLDARQRKLQEEAARLKEKEANLHRFIAEAPEKVAKLRQERQEEILSRSRAPSGRRGSATLPDKRFDVSLAGSLPAAPRRRRALKAERRQAQLISLALACLLILLVLLLWNNWRQ